MAITAKTYVWNPARTDAALSEALTTLSKRYPQLSKAKKGDVKLVFEKGENAANCSVKLADGVCTIVYGKLNMALRMLGAVLSGVTPRKADYCPFDMFGVMIDCSRNSVMTVDYMKSYLDRLAILGYNMVMIYTEETYQIESEPFFGLMRGAYSSAEIKELDEYASKLGMEMIPCIQTLAHLEQMFRWGRFGEVNDIYGILLVDDPKTYELIEKMIVTWKNSVKSKRIHLGMDEAHGVGSGRFKELHGEESRFSIINRHLAKVVEICKKHGLEPMIWSDMYFRIGSKTNDYYDKDCVIPESVAKQIPQGVELVYWDYYHDDKAFYSDWIARHRALGGEPLMGSGVWTWNKFWYDHVYTESTVVPCIAACREAKVKDVFFTMWGDDGGFCDYDSSFAGLAFSAELAFTGEVKDSVINKKFKTLFEGASYDAVRLLADICYYNIPPMVWDDPLMLLYIGSLMKRQETLVYNKKFVYADVIAAFENASAKLARVSKKGFAGDMNLARFLTDSVLCKLRYAEALLAAYQKKSGKKEAVREAALLLKNYQKNFKAFVAAFRAMWFRHNKPFGFESVQIRFAGQEARIQEALLRLNEYADGKASSIPELDDLLKVQDKLEMTWGSWARLAHGTTIV